MNKKIVKVGYGDVEKIKIGGQNPLVFVGGHVPLKIETMLYLWQLQLKNL